MTFGQTIAKLRGERNLQLRELAARVKREKGKPVSCQYISDIEHDRRGAPSDHLIDELARALDVPREFLFLLARRLPPDFIPPDDERKASAAYKALCKKAA